MRLYFLAIRIASLWNKKAKKLVRGQAQTLDRLRTELSQGEQWIWFHAASTGEAEQARPIIEAMRRQGEHRKILMSFFSPSGYELWAGREAENGVDKVVYLPFATRRNAKRFIELLHPETALFIKYEYWPAYLKELKHRAIPTYSVASVFRKWQPFFKPLTGKIYRNLLHCFTTLLVQDEASKELLAQYGITNVTIVGDPRFNRVLQVAHSTATDKTTSMFCKGDAPVIVAGSTWDEDERLLVRYINSHPNVKLVLVPHEIDQEHLHRLFNLFRGRFIRYSEASEQNIQSCQTLLVDKMGLLSILYRYATVAYIGGGFGAGIHNTLEAAAYGVPVIWGKCYDHFREATDLIAVGGGFSIRNYKQLEGVLDAQLAVPQEAGRKALAYVESEQEAVKKIAEEIR